MRSSVILSLLMAMLVGCSSGGGGDLRVTRLSDGRVLRQDFEQGYLRQGEHGDYDIVFVAETADEQASRARGNILEPAKLVPVRHIVHLRVFWRPMKGLRSDDTATSNAAVDWFVVTPGSREGDDLLRYRGSGLVSVYPGEGGASVTLRNVRIEPETIRGQMTDPLGRAAVSGSIRAVWDEEFVSNKLAEMRALTQQQTASR